MDYSDALPAEGEVLEEEPLEDIFDSITIFDWERRHEHDRDGYMAELAGSDACKALGHVDPEVAGPDDYDSEEAFDEASDRYHDLHPYGWNHDRLCESIRLGDACTACEGECDYMYDPAPSLWEMVK